MPVNLTLVTAPAVEPVTLDEAKAWLRLEEDADDALVTATIKAARQYCENLTGRSFIATVWDYVIDTFPVSGGYYNREIRARGPGPGWLPQAGGVVMLPRPALISVGSVKYYDSGGTLQTIDSSVYNVLPGSPGRLEAAYGQVWPLAQARDGAVIVRFTAGYGTTADSVPDCVKTAIKLAVAHLYENRGESTADMPSAVADLLSPEDIGSYA